MSENCRQLDLGPDPAAVISLAGLAEVRLDAAATLTISLEFVDAAIVKLERELAAVRALRREVCESLRKAKIVKMQELDAVAIGVDRRCTCVADSQCPLGKSGNGVLRCTQPELTAAGVRVKPWLPPTLRDTGSLIIAITGGQ